MEKEIIFDGGYGREGVIYKDEGRCPVCHRDEVVMLCIDGSEGEYRTGRICENCIKILLN